MKVEHNNAAMPICDDHESNVDRMNEKIVLAERSFVTLLSLHEPFN